MTDGRDISTLLSEQARSGPPLFFPDPTTRVTFNFDQGVTAEETFPIEDFKRLAVEVLEEDQGRALEYISFDVDPDTGQIIYLPSYEELVLGYRGLRRELASWLSGRNGGKDLDETNLIVTSGSVQAIALAINAFVDQGDGVVVESASFPYALRFMEMRQAEIRTVPVDEDGMDVDAVEAALQQMASDGITPKLIYTIPTFQLPTGSCLSLARRQRLVALAEEWNVVIVEDDVYGDLRYEGDALPTLLSLDTAGLVLQTHSFSKVVAPALRLGWATGSPQLVAALAAVRQDLGVSQWLSRVMTRWMAEGHLDDHIARANDLYRRRRDVAAAAVRAHCDPHLTFTLPAGGFYLWLEMGDGVDWTAAQAQAAEAGVQCRPGELFAGEENGTRYLRLAFCHVREDEIERGVRELGRAIDDNLLDA